MGKNKQPLYIFILLALFTQCHLFALEPIAPEKRSTIEMILNSPNPFEASEQLNLHSQLRILFFLSALSLIPFVLVMMTSFTRITIVLQFIKQALATWEEKKKKKNDSL